MPKVPTPTYIFAVTVVQHNGTFLLVREWSHGRTWYLPAGQVKQGETINDAAIRETYEESGLDVELIGILRIQHTPGKQADRLNRPGNPGGSGV